MLRNVTKRRWVVYILYCCLILGIERIMIKLGIEAFTWTQMSIYFSFVFIFPILITVLIIQGKIVKIMCIGIINSILSYVGFVSVSFFYSWIIFNIIFIEIIYQVDKRKLFSK